MAARFRPAKRPWLRLALAVAVLGLPSGRAGAQYLEPLPPRFPTDRDIPVANREPAGYEVPGLQIGAFTLSPSLGASAFYSDNVFAQEVGAQDDVAVRLAPTLRLRSDGPIDRVGLTLAAQVDRFANLTTENTERYDADATGLFEVDTGTLIRARLRWQRLQEPRSSQNAFVQTLEPLRYDLLTAGLGVSREWNRLRLSVEAGVVKTDYSAAQTQEGIPVDTRSRDNVTIIGRTRLEYVQSLSLSYFIQATVNKRDFAAPSAVRPKRDSKGYELLAGISFDLSAVARGEVAVGYPRQNFKSDFYQDSGNLGLNARVLFFPSRLTTVTAEAERRVENSGNPLSGSYLSTTGAMRIDHELLRTLLLTASAEYQTDRFKDIDRKDDRYVLGLRAEYRLSPHWTIHGSASHQKTTSSGLDRYRDYSENRALFGISVRG